MKSALSRVSSSAEVTETASVPRRRPPDVIGCTLASAMASAEPARAASLPAGVE